MTLTNPWALWLLPLLAVPLLLTRSHEPASRLEVSNLYLWRAAIGRSSQRLALRRVRRSWLVVLQTVAIAGAVLALGKPVITFAGGRTVLVFDVSASMAARADGTTRFEDARARARAIIRELTPTSRVALIAAADSPRDLGDFTASDPRLSLAIDALEPMPVLADLVTAGVAARSRDATSIVVLSDTTRASFEASGGNAQAVRWIDVGRPADNAAIARVAARPAMLGARGGQVVVVVRHFARAPREADVEIAVDDRLVRRVRTQLPAVGTATIDVALPDLGHVVTATLIGGDALALDDARSVAVPSAERTRVALIGSGGSFLEKVLAVNPSVSLERFDSGSPEAAAAMTVREDVDVVICDGCQEDVTGARPALVLVPADRRSASAPRPLTLANRGHAVAASLELNGVVAAVTAATADANADVILRAGGVPAVTTIEGEGQRRVTVHMDLSRQDFVLSAAFPVFVANALDWLTSKDTAPDEVSLDGESNLLSATVAPSAPSGPDIPASTGEPVAVAAWFALAALLCVAVEWRLRIAGPS